LSRLSPHPNPSWPGASEPPNPAPIAGGGGLATLGEHEWTTTRVAIALMNPLIRRVSNV
jgi:hypothetical protein